MKKKLFIFSNESISSSGNKFFCDNIDLKSTPEGLNKKFEVLLFGRKANKKRNHEIKIKKIKIKFLKECKSRVEEMQDKFPVLFNYIDSRNKLHLSWLKWCGFKIINEKTFNDVLFYGFYKEKK